MSGPRPSIQINKANFRRCVSFSHFGHLLNRISLYGFSMKAYRGFNLPMSVLDLAIAVIHGKISDLMLAARHSIGHNMIQSLLLFVLAGVCEIGGGYLFWLWLREGKSPWLAVIGMVILGVYGVPRCNLLLSDGRMRLTGAFLLCCRFCGARLSIALLPINTIYWEGGLHCWVC